MNFLKSIIADDDDHPEPDIRLESDPNSPLKHSNENNPNGVADGWGFGGLIKTFGMQSESVIEIYRRDLKEFGSGLRKETEILRETASRAVKDLPASLEAAHGALNGVLKSTASIISKESLGFSSDGEPETPGTNRSLSSGRYSRFEAQLSAIQNDLNTFCEEPEDVEDYSQWKLGFELENYKDEIDNLIGDNGILEGVYMRAVPSSVDHETFWCRYLYRVDKFKQQESARANLVKKAISVNEDEDLSWDFDDDDDDGDDQNVEGGDQKGDSVLSDGNSYTVEENAAQDKQEEGDCSVNDYEKIEKEQPEGVGEMTRDEKGKSEEENFKNNNDEKSESGEKCDAPVVDDVGWDEIEDTGSGNERISAFDQGGSSKKHDLRKRLSSVEGDDEEDLSWDIEDDDEPVKA